MKDTATRNWALLVLALGLMLSLGAAWLLHFSEQEQLRNRFVKDVSDRSAVFSRELNTSLETLYTLRTLFIGQAIPRLEDFEFVASNTRARHKDIVAIYWVPEVSAGLRDVFERDIATTNGLPSFEVLRQQADGQVVPSDKVSGLHRPVVYFQGELSQKIPLGIDLTDNYPVNSLLTQAKLSGGLTLSPGRIAIKDSLLKQGDYHSSMMKVALSIPLRGYPGKVGGYIVTVIDLRESFAKALSQIRVAGIDMKLWDQTGVQEPMLLHHHVNRTRLEIDKSRSTLVPMHVNGNRQWFMEALPTFYYFNNKATWLPHLVFVLGMSLTGLVCFSFVRIARRNAKIQHETHQLLTSNQELAEISRTDALTAVANRRYFDEVLDKEWKRSLRNKTPLTLIMVDIDCFKLYNDYYGHLEGDECIYVVAQTLSDMMSRPMDLVARYGGEEFATLLPDTNENAVILAEQCRKMIEQQRIAHAASKVSPYVTVSMGVATVNAAQTLDVSELIRHADRALYSAKANGRNQVVRAEFEVEHTDSPQLLEQNPSTQQGFQNRER